jgi:hypothetical protein
VVQHPHPLCSGITFPCSRLAFLPH